MSKKLMSEMEIYVRYSESQCTVHIITTDQYIILDIIFPFS